MADLGVHFLRRSYEKQLQTIPEYGILKIEKPLIKSGGGTGPVKPGNRTAVKVPIPDR